jgi:hypothetical protein
MNIDWGMKKLSVTAAGTPLRASFYKIIFDRLPGCVQYSFWQFPARGKFTLGPALLAQSKNVTGFSK